MGLAIRKLRCRPLTKSPHLVAYLVHADHLDVRRILRTSRDIQGTLADTDDA